MHMPDITKLSDIMSSASGSGADFVVDRAVQPDDPLYEPLYDNDPGDPVHAHSKQHRVLRSPEPQLHLWLPGLRQDDDFRMRNQLKQKGFFVAYANVLRLSAAVGAD